MEDQTPTQETLPPSRQWRFALTGCMVLIAFVVLTFVGIVVLVYKSPFYRNQADCSLRMRRVGAALERYANRNDAYPARLEDLAPEYLPKSDLHCLADKRPNDPVSYLYHRVSIDDRDGTVVLECRRHSSSRAASPSVLIYRKGGKVSF